MILRISPLVLGDDPVMILSLSVATEWGFNENQVARERMNVVQFVLIEEAKGGC